MNGVDPAEVWERLRERADDTATAIKVIDFLIDHWWVILLCVTVLALWPRGRRS